MAIVNAALRAIAAIRCRRFNIPATVSTPCLLGDCLVRATDNDRNDFAFAKRFFLLSRYRR
jgi:hypothetical protein